MSKENLIKLLEAASADEQLLQELQQTSNYEAIKQVASQHGYALGDLSEEEARQIYTLVMGEGELSDEALDSVAGGRTTFKIESIRSLRLPGTQLSSNVGNCSIWGG